MMGIFELLMRIRTKDEQCSSSPKEMSTKRAVLKQRCRKCGFCDFYREKVCLLSRFSAIRTVGSRRSKKQSCSTRRGLRVGTDLVEF